MNLEGLSLFFKEVGAQGLLWRETGVYFALVFFAFVLPVLWGVVFLKRKITADFQARVGPNRDGLFGFFQPALDLLKFLSKRKEWVGAKEKSTRSQDGWFLFFNFILFSSLCLLPVNSAVLLLDTNMSVFIPILFFLVLSWITLFSSIEEGSIVSFVGATRGAYQSLVGALVVFLSVLVLLVGREEYRLKFFVSGAELFRSPFHFLSGIIFLFGGFLLLRLPPLDEASFLRSGTWLYHRTVLGWRYALVRIGMHYATYFWCALFTLLYLRGWSLPYPISQWVGTNEGVKMALETLCMSAKTLLVIGVIHWLSISSPRVRVDQLTEFAWRVVIPVGLFCLVGAVFWVDK